MKKKTEEKYLDKEWLEMNARLKAFLETGDQEHLHKFRVQIKKLRAMLSLFEITANEAGLMKNFKPVKKIFKRAGDIREAHINLELSQRYHLKNSQFETSQQQIITDGTTEFRNRGDEFFKDIKDAHKKVKKQLQKVGDAQIAEYYKNQLEKISADLVSPVSGEDLHATRKLIKILVYNHKLAADALEGKIAFNLDYLDELQEAIGKWHDNLMAEELFSLPELDDKPIVSKIKRVNSRVKRNINKLAKDFLKKATHNEDKAKA